MEVTDVRIRGRRFVSALPSTGMPEMDASGYTVPKGPGFVITINSTESSERQRFTVCHEVAHIVLGLPSAHGDVPSWSFAKRHLNEIWCDIFASELLMPYEAFLKKIPDGEPSVDVIETLSHTFGASFPATASRYASLAPFPCAYATMDAGMVRYAEANAVLRRKGLRIAMKCPIPPGSVAHRLRQAGESCIDTDQVPQDLWLENCESSYELWELSRHYAQFDQTVSLLWCGDEELPRGEVDRFNRRINEDHEGLEELTGEITWEQHGPRRK
jgi:Zn-dependent peptidase ImmA (M78 family)